MAKLVIELDENVGKGETNLIPPFFVTHEIAKKEISTDPTVRGIAGAVLPEGGRVDVVRTDFDSKGRAHAFLLDKVTVSFESTKTETLEQLTAKLSTVPGVKGVKAAGPTAG